LEKRKVIVGVGLLSGRGADSGDMAWTWNTICSVMRNFDLVPSGELIQTVRMNFQNVLGRASWNVGEMPGARKNEVDHLELCIDPDHAEIHENEEHMDRGIEPILVGLDKQHPLIPAKS
jgi:hypothetical protein